MIRIIIAAIGLSLAGGIFFFFTQPTFDSIQAAQATIASDDAALAKAAELQTVKSTLLTKYNSFSPTDLDRLQKLLPDHVDNVRLILDLDHLAQAHNMALTNVDISGSGAPTAGAPVSSGPVGAGGKKYDSLDLRFSTTGTYDNFLSFMSDIQSSLRIVDLESLTLGGSGTSAGTSAPGAPVIANSNPGAPGSLTYSYGLALKTYWLK